MTVNMVTGYASLFGTTRNVALARAMTPSSALTRLCLFETVFLPSLRANGSRECAPDDRLREAIQSHACGPMDCFVALLLAMTGE